MGITEGLILRLNLILKVASQLVISLLRELADAVFLLQLLLSHIAQLVVVRSRQAEGVLEAVLHGRVALQEVIKSFRKSGNDDNGVVIPFVHLNEQLIQRIHLIGIFVRQELLNIIEEQDTTLCLLDVFVPLVNKALVVHGVHHRELGLVDNLVLVEVVAYDCRQCCLTSTRLANDDGVDRQAHHSDVLARAQIGIGVNDGLQLCLHIGQTDHLVQGVADDGLSAPFAELGHASVFLMTKVTCHIVFSVFLYILFVETSFAVPHALGHRQLGVYQTGAEDAEL